MPLFDEVVLLTSGLDNVISFDAVSQFSARQSNINAPMENGHCNQSSNCSAAAEVAHRQSYRMLLLTLFKMQINLPRCQQLRHQQPK